MDKKYEAGVWDQNIEQEDGVGFKMRSRHSTIELAIKAAIRYAKKRLNSPDLLTGGALTWSGGYREINNGKVFWVNSDGSHFI